jgi:hypothetical protein
LKRSFSFHRSAHHHPDSYRGFFSGCFLKFRERMNFLQTNGVPVHHRIPVCPSKVSFLVMKNFFADHVFHFRGYFLQVCLLFCQNRNLMIC